MALMKSTEPIYEMTSNNLFFLKVNIKFTVSESAGLCKSVPSAFHFVEYLIADKGGNHG
jgi:hypothetical protein